MDEIQYLIVHDVLGYEQGKTYPASAFTPDSRDWLLSQGAIQPVASKNAPLVSSSEIEKEKIIEELHERILKLEEAHAETVTELTNKLTAAQQGMSDLQAKLEAANAKIETLTKKK